MHLSRRTFQCLPGPLAQCFGETIRKMWSDKRFKSTVNPHMLVQAISVASKKRFTIGKQAEVGDFIAWLLHQIHIGVGGSTQKPGSSIIHQTFQGIVEITTRIQKPVTSSSSSNHDNNSQDGKYDRLGSDHLTRFKRNEFTNEKNPTIVTFPVKNLHLSQYVFDKDSINTSKEKVPTEAEIRKMSTKEMKKLLLKYGRSDLACQNGSIIDRFWKKVWKYKTG